MKKIHREMVVVERKQIWGKIKIPMWNKIDMLKGVHSVTLDTLVIALKTQKNLERIAATVACPILGDFHDLVIPAIIIKGSSLIAHKAVALTKP